MLRNAQNVSAQKYPECTIEMYRMLQVHKIHNRNAQNRNVQNAQKKCTECTKEIHRIEMQRTVLWCS